MGETTKENRRALLHQLRNCLGPVQTFLEVVKCDSNPALKRFHKVCRENLIKLHELIKQLEAM